MKNLTEDHHVPAKASQNVADMKPGTTSGKLVRESPTMQLARTAKGCTPKPAPTGSKRIHGTD